MIPFFNLKLQYQKIQKEYLENADQILQSGTLMDGPMRMQLELALEKRLGRHHVKVCHSGTQALGMIALFQYRYNMYSLLRTQNNARPKVIVPALTYPATINAFLNANWEVIIADVDSSGVLDFGRIDPQSCDGVCAVGLFGKPVKWTQSWLERKALIEDGAQHWQSGTPGKVLAPMAISFDPTKNLGAHGNGGAIVCDDKVTANWITRFQNNGKPKYDSGGTNSRMSELDCLSVILKLRYLDEWQDRRKDIAGYWIDQFAQCENIRCLIDQDELDTHGLQKFVIDIPKRDMVKQSLSEAGVECKIHYEKPLHEYDFYSDCKNPGHVSTASMLSRRLLTLPFYPELTDAEVETIATQVLDHVNFHNETSATSSRNSI